MSCRPRRLEHGVAETAAHAIQHRGVLEELRLGRRQPGQELGAEVLGHEPVVAVEARRRPSVPVAPACIDSAARYRPAGQPSVRAVSSESFARVELDSGGFQQQLGLLLVQPEVRHADLVHRSLRAPAGKRQRRLFPARDRDLRAGRDVLEQRREHVQTGRIGDGMQIVEHQHERALERGQCAPEARDARRPGGCHRAGQRVEHLGRQRLDAVNRGRDVAQEHHGVVVSPRRARPTRTDADRPRPTAQAASSCRTRPARRRSRKARSRVDKPRDHVPSSPRCRAARTARRA